MSVSLRVTGTWAELTADGTVAIPATPQSGDRMFLFARWKDFSVTATVANWTELTEFADGSTTSGNGTGSVKVACWYQDWQSGDSDPTIDFSANPENASVVIMVMAKGADDVWDTPVARTAAMTSWTTTSQSVSASAIVDVRSSGVVIGLIGIRDDTATMTRPTNGIDDAGALVTWNGNYVESPATHHSTTTGDDGAADLGYRLVTTGATGATLRLTGTISAAETGAALWVVQGVNTLLTPTSATLTSSQFAPQLRLSLTPAAASLTSTQFAPQLRLAVTPSAVVLTVAGFAPAFGVGVVPAAVALSVSSFAPMLSLYITPSTVTVTVTTFAPQLNESLTPASASLAVTGFAPATGIGLVPSAASLTLNLFAPSTTLNTLITVPNASLTLTMSKPHVLPFNVVFIDPGGDAVQAIGYFGTKANGPSGVISFDTSQKVNGIGSYKFDSDDGGNPTIAVPSVMGATRRLTTQFRYDSVPDATSTVTAVDIIGTEVYSGGGLDPGAGSLSSNLSSDNEEYATATPAKNSGQGTVFSLWGLAGGTDLIPLEAAIKSVKIRYERKYDIDTSIGISRVKYRLDGVEGPNHDNTDMPLTDTVVEVDVTGDRESWARDELANGRFEVIVEARRGDTDTPHTQLIDFVAVEVEYFIPFTILGPSGEGLGFEFALVPRGDRATLRLIDGDKVWYDGITELLPDTDHRISWAHVLHDTNLIDIKLYVDSIEELSIEDAKCAGGISNLVNLLHGWVVVPGENKVCWFDQLAIDAGDDLGDIGNILSTHKGPATVNEDNWDTDGGTGAVNERPLSETNHKEHSTPFDSQYQTYNLQAASVGDIDISGETLVGYMGWAWARKDSDPDVVRLITNGVEVNRVGQLASTPRLITQPVTSVTYPGNARGIGMLVTTEVGLATMYDIGVVMAYEGPPNPNVLLPRQEVVNETLDTIIDDLRADPPDSYEVCCTVQEFDGVAVIDAYSIDAEGNSPQFQGTMSSSGGIGRMRITPGIEVQVVVSVTGVTMIQVWRRLNVD